MADPTVDRVVPGDPATDPAAFSERVLQRPLWEHQVEAARSEAFITVVAKARRTGGTVLAETLATHTAATHRDCKVLLLSATEDAARRLTESIGATLARRPELRGAVVDDFATRIRLANGSQIISLPASQRQVRGYGVAAYAASDPARIGRERRDRKNRSTTTKGR